MANKMKAWREASRRNTMEGKLTPRQWEAAARDYAGRTPSTLLGNLLKRVGVTGVIYARG